jgi:hypothetical protein
MHPTRQSVLRPDPRTLGPTGSGRRRPMRSAQTQGPRRATPFVVGRRPHCCGAGDGSP